MSDIRPDTDRSRRLWRWWIVGLIVVGGLLSWWYWRAEPASNQTPGATSGFAGQMGAMKVPVRAARVEQSTINIVFPAIGTVTAFNTVTVRSRVDGELIELLFDEGQQVNKGDLLARIDPRSYQVQLDQALGQQKQNQAQLANARRDLQRYQKLFEQNSIARQQYDAQKALVEQYEGREKIDQAAVDHARLQLSYTQITAPIDGRLGLRKIDAGNLVSASSSEGLVVITQTQPIAVVFSLPQSQLAPVLAQLNKGEVLPTEVYDRQGNLQLAQGELVSIDNQIDPSTGTFTLRARVENADNTLFPNQFVNVRLKVVSDEPALVIPTAAVQQGSRGPFVYLVNNDDTVSIRLIETGTVDEGRIEVLHGLEADELVVVEGTDRLREGAKVEVVSSDDAPEQALLLPTTS
ncbi:MAG TPA: MdtA/MuxA family multidrug efflux RND transporter periplasmic adaptor subunit [Burkholderiaceae bacterium]|nr:MdtA/MuxA family multidrug efflux RND transporter periplasmic adaptor subunit [Burkholderiaceae bacterium]